MSTGIMIIGPSGSGKTTLGKVVAEKLGYAIT
jgi:adenylate kinase family enzyme